ACAGLMAQPYFAFLRRAVLHLTVHFNGKKEVKAMKILLNLTRIASQLMLPIFGADEAFHVAGALPASACNSKNFIKERPPKFGGLSLLSY
ncbi:MAG: hypothetical protein J4N99_09675, partial [Chloroflexi bacterium]|nr:hypothetical protein [Chloroflexota bacterium]